MSQSRKNRQHPAPAPLGNQEVVEGRRIRLEVVEGRHPAPAPPLGNREVVEGRHPAPALSPLLLPHGYPILLCHFHSSRLPIRRYLGELLFLPDDRPPLFHGWHPHCLHHPDQGASSSLLRGQWGGPALMFGFRQDLVTLARRNLLEVVVRNLLEVVVRNLLEVVVAIQTLEVQEVD